MGVFRRTRTPLSALAVLIATFTVARPAEQPGRLRVDGVPSNDRVISMNPTFCWDFSGAQTNWQIQVDDDPLFRPGAHATGPKVWFWDSGMQAKGKAGTSRCARMREQVAAGFPSRPLDRRPQDIYWRVRVQTSGGGWGPWSVDTLRMNAPPGMPGEVSVVDEAATGRPITPLGTSPDGGSPAGRTFFVSPEGDDQAGGTRAAPFRSLQRATQALAPGDTLLVHGGTYQENLVISHSSGHRSGEAGRPIQVRAFPGETPVLSAPATGTRTAFQIGPDSRISHWEIDGLTLGGEATLVGLRVLGATDIVVTNCRLGAMPPEATGIAFDGGAGDLTVAGCVFAQPVAVQVDVAAAGPVVLRDNEFARFDGDHAVRKQDPVGGGIVLSRNRLHDGSPRGAAVLLAQGAAGSQIVGNVLDRVSGDGIVIDGSAQIVIENNVLHQIEGAGIRFESMGQHGVYRNNIFVRCEEALSSGSEDAGPPGTWMSRSVIDYNLFFDNGSDLEDAAWESTHLAHPPVGNCRNCDPLFLDSGRSDFTPGPHSPAVDAADPQTPVPSGGGARADIGAFEAGAGDAPYDYRVRFSVADATPRIAWQLRDIDGDLSTRPDGQARFQVQIDPRMTFDSLGTAPLFDTGVVTSGEERFILPAAWALPAGDYYVRVRQWDDRESSQGAWSDARTRFRVLAEPQPPYLGQISPADGTSGVDRDATVRVLLKDSGSGVDAGSIQLYVNGVPVRPVVEVDALDARVTWAPQGGFSPGETVSIRVLAEDKDPLSPGMDATYRFQVRGDTPRSGPGNIRVAR